VFQSPEGDSSLFYPEGERLEIPGLSFQSPEGDSSLFYWPRSDGIKRAAPRFSPPKGIRLFSTRSAVPETLDCILVSVPRRGFVSFLPEGIKAVRVKGESFSPPKGIRLFSTKLRVGSHHPQTLGFQSPEGDSSLFYLGLTRRSSSSSSDD